MLEFDNSSVRTDELQKGNPNSSVRTDEIEMGTPNLSVQTDEMEVGKVNSPVRTDELDKSFKDCFYSLQRISLPNFPAVAFLSISFSHHIAILTNVKDIEQRKFYMQYAHEFKVKVETLVSLIKSDLYHHQGNLPNNFRNTIPDQLQAFRAIAMFKDEYLLDFINTEELFVRDKDRDERLIEQSIVQNVKNFIMTFVRTSRL